MLLEATDVVMEFGSFRAVNGASLTVTEGDIVGLIGPNGAGKSTFFNCVAGDLTPTSGTIRFKGHDVTRATPEQHARLGMARSFQVPVTFEDMSVAENVMVGAFLRHAETAAATEAARAVGQRLGLGAFLDRPASALTVAGRKRLEVARALATGPRLLLLDEVMAGLNPTEIHEIVAMIRDIRDGGITILLIEHIMQAVAALADDVYVLAEGALIAHGTPKAIADDPRVIEAYLGRGAAARLAAHA